MAQSNAVTASLVVFMGLSGVLGTTTYIGAKGASETRQQVEAVKQESSDLQSQQSKASSGYKALAEKLGYPDNEGGFEKLEEQIRSDIKGALGTVDQNTTYRDALLAVGREYKHNLEESRKYNAFKESAEGIASAHTEMTTTQQETFTQARADQDSSYAAAKSDSDDRLQALKTASQAQTDGLTNLEQETKKEIAAENQKAIDFKEASDNLQAINRNLSARVDELSNADYERADGSVVYSDQVLKVARLNIGSKDGVRPLTTFNVFPPDTIEMSVDKAKGSVQVVRTLGDHLCEAKILEDEMSDPVLAGDLIYTPLWRPGKVIRYALDYGLDVNGDGISDLDEVMNLILSSGAEVAAYIDDDGVVQGEITGDVYKIVRSDKQITDVVAHDSSRNQGDREKLIKVDEEFLKTAKDLEIPEIYLKDFLASVGYKETAKITRYRQKGGVDLQDNGVSLPQAAANPVAPIHNKNADKAEAAPGIVAPLFRSDSEPAPVSTGKVSDYYFRKRATRSE